MGGQIHETPKRKYFQQDPLTFVPLKRPASPVREMGFFEMQMVPHAPTVYLGSYITALGRPPVQVKVCEAAQVCMQKPLPVSR